MGDGGLNTGLGVLTSGGSWVEILLWGGFFINPLPWVGYGYFLEPHIAFYYLSKRWILLF